MMYSTAIFSVVAALLVGQAIASSSKPMPIRAMESAEVERYSPEAREIANLLIEVVARQFGDSAPAMAPHGNLKPFANGGKDKRQFGDSAPAMAPHGDLKPFANGGKGKRFGDSTPAMAPKGVIKPFANGGKDKRSRGLSGSGKRRIRNARGEVEIEERALSSLDASLD